MPELDLSGPDKILLAGDFGHAREFDGGRVCR